MRFLSPTQHPPAGKQLYPLTVGWLECNSIEPFDKQGWGDSWRWIDIHVRWDSSRQASRMLSASALFAAVKDGTKEERTEEDETWLAALPSTYIPAWMANPLSHSRLQTKWIKTWWRMIQHCINSNTFPLHTSRAWKSHLIFNSLPWSSIFSCPGVFDHIKESFSADLVCWVVMESMFKTQFFREIERTLHLCWLEN